MIRGVGPDHGDQRGQMPNALGIGLLGPRQMRDETGRPVHVGGRPLQVLLTLLALNAGRVVPAGSLAGELWPDDPARQPGNALQTLVFRLGRSWAWPRARTACRGCRGARGLRDHRRRYQLGDQHGRTTLPAAVADLSAGTAPHSARTGGRGACAAGARALYGACAVRSAWRAQRKRRHGDSGLAAVWPGRWSLSAEATGRVEWVDVRRG